MIGQMVIDKLLEDVEEVTDVTVHIDPEDDEIAALCQGLPLRAEVERRLETRWRDIPGAERRERLILHYLDGRILADVIFPADSIRNLDEARQLQSRLQEGIQTLPDIAGVRVLFG